MQNLSPERRLRRTSFERGPVTKWTFGGNGAAMYAALGRPSESVIYSTPMEAPDWKKPLPGVDMEFLLNDAAATMPGEKRITAHD